MHARMYKDMIIVEEPINGAVWTWRIKTRGNPGSWVVSLLRRDHPTNPTTIYAYRVRDKYDGTVRYIISIYPRGCGESGCALFYLTEADDRDLPFWMRFFAEIADLMYTDPERFYDEIEESDVYELSDVDLEDYEELPPDPELARKLYGIIWLTMNR